MNDWPDRPLYWRVEREEQLVPADTEVVLLEDPHESCNRTYRVGDRIGGIVHYGGPDPYCSFVDYGPFAPEHERPAHAQCPADYCLYLQEQEDEARDKAALKDLRAAQEAFPEMAHARRLQWMIHNVFVWDRPMPEHGTPRRPADVIIRCTDCRETIGRSWKTSQGWLIYRQWVPQKESKIMHLSSAMHFRELGWEAMAEYEIAWADYLDGREAVQGFWAADTIKGNGDGRPLLLGCQTHLNVLVDRGYLQNLVKNATPKPGHISLKCSK